MYIEHLVLSEASEVLEGIPLDIREANAAESGWYWPKPEALKMLV